MCSRCDGTGMVIEGIGGGLVAHPMRGERLPFSSRLPCPRGLIVGADRACLVQSAPDQIASASRGSKAQQIEAPDQAERARQWSSLDID